MGLDGPTTMGTLQLINTDNSRVSRVFITKNEMATRIAQVVCNEFGYNGYNWANARSANDVKNQFNDNLPGLVQFLNEKNFYGLECTGLEQTFKDCKVNSSVTLDTNLFEIELQCVGMYSCVFAD